MVEIRYFAAIADFTGRNTESVDFPTDATIGDLKADLIHRYGEAFAPMLKVAAYLIGDELTRDASALLTARVDVLPPFAGG